MKKIVTVGGGTGSHTVLSGLKNLKNVSLTALVSMADDGGTNGMLRNELGVLPPSDIRQCLVALSEEELLSKLMSYRFQNGILAGYNFGSIFIATLEKICGDFTKAVEITSKILKIKNKVIPVTRDKAELQVLFLNGKKIIGESKISAIDLKISAVRKIFYKNKIKLNPKAAQAIRKADYIIICPGGFYTSIVPNLIVGGFKKALAKSKAKIIAVENLGNKETDNYLNKLEWYLGRPVDNLIKGEKFLISHVKIVKEPQDKIKRSSIRHDSKKLAKVISKIINK